MSKIDTRKQSTEVQQHNREQAIRLQLKGLSRAYIAEIISVTYHKVINNAVLKNTTTTPYHHHTNWCDKII